MRYEITLELTARLTLTCTWNNRPLAKHIPIENALIPIFVFLGAKLSVTAFCNCVLVAAP